MKVFWRQVLLQNTSHDKIFFYFTRNTKIANIAFANGERFQSAPGVLSNVDPIAYQYYILIAGEYRHIVYWSEFYFLQSGRRLQA